MSNSNEIKTIRVPIFDGKEENYQTWWVRFRACGKLSGFVKALEDAPETDLPKNQAESKALTGTEEAVTNKKAAAKETIQLLRV